MNKILMLLGFILFFVGQTYAAPFNSTYAKGTAFNITNNEVIANRSYRLNLTPTQISFSDFSINGSETVITNSTNCDYQNGDEEIPFYIQTWDGTRGIIYFTPSINIGNKEFCIWHKNITSSSSSKKGLDKTATLYGNDFDNLTNGQEITGWSLGGAGSLIATNYSSVSGSMSMVLNNTNSVGGRATLLRTLPDIVWIDVNVLVTKRIDNQDLIDLMDSSNKRLLVIDQHCCGSNLRYHNGSSLNFETSALLNNWYHFRVLYNVSKSTTTSNGYLFLNHTPVTADNTTRDMGDELTLTTAGEGFAAQTGGGSDNQTIYYDNIFISVASPNQTNYLFSATKSFEIVPKLNGTNVTDVIQSINAGAGRSWGNITFSAGDGVTLTQTSGLNSIITIANNSNVAFYNRIGLFSSNQLFTGNVCIGSSCSTPITALDVRGNINATGQINVSKIVVWGASSNLTEWINPIGTPLASINSTGGAEFIGGLRVNSLANCDTIDTDASGNLRCGTDAGSSFNESGISRIVSFKIGAANNTLSIPITGNWDFITVRVLINGSSEPNSLVVQFNGDNETNYAVSRIIASTVLTAINQEKNQRNITLETETSTDNKTVIMQIYRPNVARGLIFGEYTLVQSASGAGTPPSHIRGSFSWQNLTQTSGINSITIRGSVTTTNFLPRSWVVIKGETI